MLTSKWQESWIIRSLLPASQNPAHGSSLSVPGSEPTLLPILIYTTVALILLLLVISWRILVRVGRVERMLTRESSDEPESSDRSASLECQPGGPFEAFLAEDPSRVNLSKSEQFAAYRRWRQEKGLNWSNS
jgi:hypothetical protein